MDLIIDNLESLSIFGLIWAILTIVGMWRIFEKAGEAGWKALIPIYDFYILFKICWKPSMFWAWLACTLIGTWLTVFTGGFLYIFGMALTLITAVMMAVLWFNLSASFGKGLLFFLGLFLFTPLFIIILGFSSARYLGNRYY